MLHEGDVELFGVLHGPPHDDRILYSIAIVGVQSYSVLREGMKWAELQATSVHSDTRRWNYVD